MRCGIIFRNQFGLCKTIVKHDENCTPEFLSYQIGFASLYYDLAGLGFVKELGSFDISNLRFHLMYSFYRNHYIAISATFEMSNINQSDKYLYFSTCPFDFSAIFLCFMPSNIGANAFLLQKYQSTIILVT